MRRIVSAIYFVSLATSAALHAQDAVTTQARWRSARQGTGRVIVPTSSLERPEDLGERAHTHFLIFVPTPPSESSRRAALSNAATNPQPVPYYDAETPASLACLYGLTHTRSDCNPGLVPNADHAVGGSRAIVLVDAYDYPTAESDLAHFSAKFGLPQATFAKIYQGSAAPTTDPNCDNGNGWSCWSSEEALDIEMAHAMAPSAKIYLAEANSQSFADLFATVQKAAEFLAGSTVAGGEISMSFGGAEFQSEADYDFVFSGKNVVFFASTGDHEGTDYPSVSPDVVAVGGTTIARNPANGEFEAEIAWEDGGGGFSYYEPQPSYQDEVFGTATGNVRGVPDVAAVGNPRTGVWVYDTYQTPNYLGEGNVSNGWEIFGGTSVSSPLWAGIVNRAAKFSASSTDELKLIYGNGKKTANLRDITYGSCGYYDGGFAEAYWDPCTGLGSPQGSAGK